MLGSSKLKIETIDIFGFYAREEHTEKRYIADSKDVTVDDWRDIKTNKYGLKATTRFSTATLRSNELAKNEEYKTDILKIKCSHLF